MLANETRSESVESEDAQKPLTACTQVKSCKTHLCGRKIELDFFGRTTVISSALDVAADAADADATGLGCAEACAAI